MQNRWQGLRVEITAIYQKLTDGVRIVGCGLTNVELH